MADSSNKTHIPSPPSSPLLVPTKSKSLFSHYFFSKSLMIIFVLLVFSYFPSQVPDMFKETTLINKLWDLIYLFVIGIVVSYGLFSRKADSVHFSDINNNNNNIVGNESYFSGISQISSIFEDGNLYGFDEKSWVEGKKGKGLGSRSCEVVSGKKVKQCFVGESFVVINDEKFVLGQLGSGKKTVRQNLGSKSLDSAVGKSVVGDSDSDSDSGLRKWFKDSKKGSFKGLVPVKLEEKFKESGNDSDSDSGSGLDSRARFSRRSKSMRLEKRDDMFTGEVDKTVEFDFEGVKSQSMRFGMPSKIRNLSEKEETKGVEAVEVNHNRYRKPYLNRETSFVESKHQESSNGGFSEMQINHQKKKSRLSATEIVKEYNGTLDGSSEESVKEFGKIKVDDGAFDLKNNKQFVRSKSQSSSIGASSETLKNMLRKEEKEDISSSIPKPANNVSNYKRGKSVRTNRSKEQVLESKVNMFHIQTDDDKAETRSKPGTDEMNENADEMSDAEPHSGEVDRKAEEFIAKFREQIRLQKVASARKLNLL